MTFSAAEAEQGRLQQSGAGEVSRQQARWLLPKGRATAQLTLHLLCVCGAALTFTCWKTVPNCEVCRT